MPKSDGNREDTAADGSGMLTLAEREQKRQKMLDSGFTEAEIMAMEFSQEHGPLLRRQSSPECNALAITSIEKSGTDDSSGLPLNAACICLFAELDCTLTDKCDPEDDDESRPADPFNPLNEAYDVGKYEELQHRHKRRRTRGRRWEHDWYRQRSPSPIRERTDGPMWDTRAGSWRSRAGGVCLAPTEEDQDEEPARYKIPLRVQLYEREKERWEEEQALWQQDGLESGSAMPPRPIEEEDDGPRPRRGSPVYVLDEPL
ncbi:hypothetical protein FOZ60_002031 [Perkinsus olseni]|uniref:Uncharacterized protein n=1 Tax=Perkinsus olseni TaxID=32597 RepID=A0A7J6P061_PEROL|nr:hypothetical protein FOZ60_002031 [Perkinsus olseni]